MKFLLFLFSQHFQGTPEKKEILLIFNRSADEKSLKIDSTRRSYHFWVAAHQTPPTTRHLSRRSETFKSERKKRMESSTRLKLWTKMSPASSLSTHQVVLVTPLHFSHDFRLKIVWSLREHFQDSNLIFFNFQLHELSLR